MNPWLRFRITIQTIKDYKKLTIIIAFLFMVIAAMYAGMFPSFRNVLEEMVESGFAEQFSFFGPGSGDMATYVGFINLELYQLFWILILGILIGFISASLISKEIEGKTIDLLMSNPISRKQIIFEKFLGLIPLVLIVNFATMLSVMGITIAIGETLNFGNLFLTHLVSIPYFIALISIGLLISVIIDEKMKASIIFIAILMGMYVLASIGNMIPDYKSLGNLSITRYFTPYDLLKYGNVNVSGILVFVAVITVCLILSMIYFEHKDIPV